jgi:outer membrane protein OmpA-like peptidoglycan-associated protein
MIYLSVKLGPWLIAIFLVGAATALWTRIEETRTRPAPWLIWCALAFAVAAALAGLRVLQGASGLWLELAVAAFAAYVLGAAAGSLWRKHGFAEHDKWAVGLVPAALIWLMAGLAAGPSIEADIAKSVRAKIDKGSETPPQFVVEGRDVLIGVNTPHREALAQEIKTVEGVRRVATTDRFLGEPLSGPGEPATIEAGKTSEAPAVAAGAGATPKRSKEEPGPPAETTAGAQADQTEAGAQKTPSEQKPERMGAKVAAAELKAIPKTGELDVADCQKAIAAVLTLDQIQFRMGSAAIKRGSASVLDRLAAFLKRCPSAEVEIDGHTDNIGRDVDNQALSQRRAEAVLKYLTGEGVAPTRMTAIGFGAQRPIASNDDEQGRSENRRIELLLK